MHAQRAHRASEQLRVHLFCPSGEHSRRLSGPRRVSRAQSEDVKVRVGVNAKHVAGPRVRSRDQGCNHTFLYASKAAHKHSQIHQKRLHSSHSSYKDECSQLGLQLHLHCAHASVVYGFDFFSDFFSFFFFINTLKPKSCYKRLSAGPVRGPHL